MTSKVNNQKEKVVLSYHDCLLRNQDVDLLRGPYWLNDAIIGFYFEYLQHKLDDSSENTKKILLISPELTQLLKLTDSSDYPAFLGPLNAGEYAYVILPVNNCDSRDAAGGSHWSLLVFSKKEKTAFHLDSCRGMNKEAAVTLAKSIMDYLSDQGEKHFIEETHCPQQENGYDCGLFALCFTDVIIRHVRTVDEIHKCKFDGVKSIVRTKREELLDLIDELKNSKTDL